MAITSSDVAGKEDAGRDAAGKDEVVKDVVTPRVPVVAPGLWWKRGAKGWLFNPTAPPTSEPDAATFLDAAGESNRSVATVEPAAETVQAAAPTPPAAPQLAETRFNPALKLGIRLEEDLRVSRVDPGHQGDVFGVCAGWQLARIDGTAATDRPQLYAAIRAAKAKGSHILLHWHFVEEPVTRAATVGPLRALASNVAVTMAPTACTSNRARLESEPQAAFEVASALPPDRNYDAGADREPPTDALGAETARETARRFQRLSTEEQKTATRLECNNAINLDEALLTQLQRNIDAYAEAVELARICEKLPDGEGPVLSDEEMTKYEARIHFFQSIIALLQQEPTLTLPTSNALETTKDLFFSSIASLSDRFAAAAPVNEEDSLFEKQLAMAFVRSGKADDDREAALITKEAPLV